MAWRLITTAVTLLALALPASAEPLTLPGTLVDAMVNAYEVQTARAVSRQYRADAKVARSEYFPQVQGFYATEHDQVLKQTPIPFFSVGPTTVNAITRWQNIFGTQTNWTLFDFGQRRNNYRSASQSAAAYSLKAEAAVRDLKLNIIDTYEKTLTAYRTLKFRQQSVDVFRQIYQVKRRVYEAGDASRIDVAEQALQLSEAEDAVREAKEALTERLSELGSFTHQRYDPETVELADFGDPGIFAPPALVANKLLETEMYDLQIGAKRAEIRSLWAQQMPQISAYSALIFYGTNLNRLSSSVSNIAPRVVTAGIALQWTLFDGLKLAAQRERKRAEIEQLRIERNQKLWEIQTKYDKQVAVLQPIRAQLSTNAEIITTNEQKIGMYKRLVSGNITDACAMLKQQAELIDKQLSQEKLRIQQAAAQERLRVITGT